MNKTTIQVDEEVRVRLRELAQTHWEPYNETLRRLLEMPSSRPTVGQGEGEHDANSEG